MAADLRRLLQLLADHRVQFVLVGGVAAIAHGSARATYDVDVVYARDRENIYRLVSALAPFGPYLRGAPPGLPFRWNAETVQAGLNFTLTTALGDLDLLGEVVGGGSYENLLAHSLDVKLLDSKIRIVTLERLIQLKRAAGRPKDLEAIAELQALLEERRTLDSSP